MPIGNGGIIGKANAPTSSSATGVWSIREAVIAQLQGNWPVSVVSDPDFEYTTLLLPGNGTNGAQNNTFLDSSTNAFSITRNGNTTQGTFTPFSQTGWSNYFDGNGDELSAGSNAAFSFGTGAYTVEMWVYPTVATSSYSSGSGPILFFNDSSGGIGMYDKSGTGIVVETRSGPSILSSSTSMTANQWNHIALVRNSTSANQTSIFLNGLRIANGTDSTNWTVTGPLKIGGITFAGYYLTGYMSNFRFVKGTAVYDPTLTTLTVPTAPLTAITNTSLLTCQSNRFVDNSSNAFAITRNGDVSVQAFSPFNPITAYSTSAVGGSGYFDGSGDYITVANATALQLTSSTAFTLEFWFYANALSAQQHIYMGYNTASPYAGWGFAFGANANPNTTLVFWDGTTWRTVASSLTTGQWYHVAVTSEGTASTGRLYLNGAQQGSAFTVASTINNTAQAIAVGAQNDGSLPFNGYVSNVRMLKGTAAYTGSTYTIPTAPFTNVTNTSLLYNFTNGGIYDATSKNYLETVGNAQISTTQSKFGGSSMYFDGTGDWLVSRATPDLELGSGDFTIEMWVYPSALTAGEALISKGNASSTGNEVWTLQWYGTNQLAFFSGGGLGTPVVNTGSIFTTGTWYHVAVTRYSGTTRLFVNGVVAATSTASYTIATGGPLYVGAGWFDPATRDISGYLQDVRITKGIARYTSNFTPPTAAFPVL